MDKIERPTAISDILENFNSEENAKMCVELEEYIANLESKQPDRPDRIDSILQQLAHQTPTMAETLKYYLQLLEASQTHQQENQSGAASSDSSDNSSLPVWSHERAMQRRHHRQERAARKRNNYQGLKEL